MICHSPDSALGRSLRTFPLMAFGWTVVIVTAILATEAVAAVTGSGDVLPSVADPDNPGSFVLNIPVNGGAVSQAIIIGGTGQAINDTDIGQMFIDAPAFTNPVSSPTGVIGGTAAGSGRVQISSAGSLWRIATSLIVGEAGQGTLDLVNGGAVTGNPNSFNTNLSVIVADQNSAQGSLLVRNINSLLRSNTLTVGRAGSGQMQILGQPGVATGSQVDTLTLAIIGDVGSGPDLGAGFVSVDGQGTRWTIGSVTGSNVPGSTGQLVLGNAGGRGILEIKNQAQVRVTNATSNGGNVVIANSAGSLGEVVVDGQFTQLLAFGAINVGAVNNARGTLRVQNRGQVRANGNIAIGVDGVLEITGGTILTPVGIFNNGTIQTSVGGIGQIDSDVTNNASGEIRTAGTADRVRERLIFTRGVTNEGLVTSIGGEMEFLSLVNNDANGTIAGRDAVYRFRDGLTNDGILGFSVGNSDVFGPIVNNGDIAIGFDTNVTFYDQVSNSGTIQLASTGTAMFLQDLDFTSTALMSIQLNEVASVTDFSQMHIAGLTTLDGTLAVEALSGLNPQPGDSYTILTGTNINGTFDLVSFPTAPGNNWQIQYNPTSVVLNFIDAPAFNSDWNMDDIVDALDLALWRANFGMAVAPGTNGDADGDGDVDGADFSIWQRQLGTDPVATPAAGAVPEPASAALLLVALAFAARRRVK